MGKLLVENKKGCNGFDPSIRNWNQCGPLQPGFHDLISVLYQEMIHRLEVKPSLENHYRREHCN